MNQAKANWMETAREALKQEILKAAQKAMQAGVFSQAELPAFGVEVPADHAHGDFSSNAAMVWARALHMAPRQIADGLIGQMVFPAGCFASCEVAGPGFLNFKLCDSWFASVLNSVEAQKETYGQTDLGKGKSVLVEFVSANPTGPMHIGNARGGALGDCLAACLEAAGYDTKREFYVNDAGNQIEKFGLSLDLRYQEVCGQAVEMPEDSYHGADIIAHAQNFFDKNGDQYLNATQEERRKALVEYALPLNVKTLETDLGRYRICYDKWFFESTLHQNGEVARVLKLLQDSGYTYEQEGALWFKAEQFGCEKDYVLVRSNGLPTYVVPDIAYHYNKLAVRNFDLAIDVLGADHHGYVPRLKAALQALGVNPDRLQVVLMQMVRLVRGGETVKLSKRSGKAITLATLLDEVPMDAARFYFNLREANTHFDFDLDLAVEQSSSNPVYYVQYAHARICSILKRLEEEGITYAPCDESTLCLLTQTEEKELVRHLATLPDVINQAATDRDPSLMTKYLLELAGEFHKFYNSCKVNCGQADLTAARMQLCVAVRQVLANGLKMLKINAPTSM